MTKVSLKKGAIVCFEGAAYEILQLVDMKSVLAKSVETERVALLTIDALTSFIALTFGSQPTRFQPPEKFDANMLEVANKRKEIIDPFLSSSYTKADIIERGKLYEVSVSSIYRWLKAYETSGLLSSLIPKHKNKGLKGTLRIREETEILIAKIIDEMYLNKQKYTVRKVYNEIVRKCHNAKLNPPHENTIRNRIRSINEAKKLASRESARLADRKYRNTDGMFPEGLYPLDVIQIDHTPVDLIIVDEKYRKPIGRPYLTVAIDVYSRMIAGFYISLEEPSYFSVSQCLSMAILPKDKFLRDMKVDGEWSLWGIPRSIHMDNAQEFRGNELKRVCDQYGIAIAWRPVARPQFGAHIERLIGTLMREIHTIPGTTFSNIRQRGEYKPDIESAMTYNEFEHYLTEFIVNVYHKRVHSGINMIPEKRYEQGVFGDELTPGRGFADRVEDEDKFRISLLPSVERTVQRFGVKIDRITYYADSLRRWISTKENGRAKVFIFKRDPRDISVIWFYDPEIEDYFPVPYRNVSYPAISIWDLRAAQRYLDEKNLPSETEEHLFAAYDKLKSIVEESIEKSKKARRRKTSNDTMKHKRDQDFSNDKASQRERAKVKASLFDELFKDVTAFDGIIVKVKNK